MSTLLLSPTRAAATVLGMLALFGAGGFAPAESADAKPAASLSAKQSAVIDLTGFWVAIVDEDWRWRMLTAPIGDVASIPVNPEGLRVAKAWNPIAEQQAGEQCKAYGAAGVMRLPLRLHILWTDDATLEIDTDAGEQKRWLHFEGQWDGKASPQGYSTAAWFRQVQQRGFNRPYGGVVAGGGGSLKVITSHMTPGYLRTNGVPYSADAKLLEYFDRIEDEGVTYLILTSVVSDPTYLTDEYVTSYEFKLEPDGSKWHPEPCRITLPNRGPIPQNATR